VQRRYGPGACDAHQQHLLLSQRKDPYKVLGDILEESLFKHGHGGDHSGFAAGGQRVEFDIARDERGDKLGIRCCTSAATSDGLTDIVYLHSHLSVALRGREKCDGDNGKAVHRTSYCTFSQFLSATIGPAVARVSAPRTIPSLKRQPTIVVPVLVAFGIFTPLLSRKALLSKIFQ
jgi:hypothetical protein